MQKQTALCALNNWLSGKALGSPTFTFQNVQGKFVAILKVPDHLSFTSSPMPKKKQAMQAAAALALDSLVNITENSSSRNNSTGSSSKGAHKSFTQPQSKNKRKMAQYEHKTEKYVAKRWAGLAQATTKRFPFSLVDRKDRKCHFNAQGDGVRLIALDCETVEVVDNPRCLARVSLVVCSFSESGGPHMATILDEFVVPPSSVTNYSPLSGVTARDLEQATLSQQQVQQRVMELISPDDYLVGHGIHHDLNYLSIYHPRLIDTACLYRYENLQKALSLQDIYELLFQERIYSSTMSSHDSVADCQACLRIVLFELERREMGSIPPFKCPPLEKRCTLFLSSIPTNSTPEDVITLLPPHLASNARVWHPALPSSCGIRFETGKMTGNARLTFRSRVETEKAFVALQGICRQHPKEEVMTKKIQIKGGIMSAEIWCKVAV